jgi:hypothetical protein
MAWYVWVLIVVALVVIGWLKLKFLKIFMAKRAENQKSMEEDD